MCKEERQEVVKEENERRAKEEDHENPVYKSDLYNRSIDILYLEFYFIFLSLKM